MAKYAITPWRSQIDLLQVREQLYRLDPDSPDHRRNAVDRVMAWKLRGNLPHAVESTALLIDAILHHDIISNSIFSVRAVYSAAFTRFVTGFCDIGRNRERSLEPSSMLDIAKQIGMPTEFVALRHEATHEELPAIQRLVKAADQALQWLWNVYWSRLEEPESGEAVAASLVRLKADAKQILRSFRAARREAVKAKKHNSGGQEEEIWKTSKTCVDLCGSNATRTEGFVSVLVEQLSPSKRQLGTSLAGAYLIWDRLLQDIVEERGRFMPALVKGLLQAMSTPSAEPVDGDAGKEAYCMWLLHILHDGAWTTTNTTLEEHVLRKDVMMWCCMHPGHWTRRLGSKLLEAEDPEFENDWEDVFEASQVGNAETSLASDGVGGAGKLRASSPGFLDDISGTRFGRDEFRKKPCESVDEDEGSGNWVRAPTPINAPIGVVR